MAKESLYLFRLKVLSLITIGLLVALWFRAGFLQVARGDLYRQKSTEMKVYTKLIPAVRGTIYDRTGQRKIALEAPSFDLYITPCRLFPDEVEEKIIVSRTMRKKQGAYQYVLNAIRELSEKKDLSTPGQTAEYTLNHYPDIELGRKKLLKTCRDFMEVVIKHPEISDKTILRSYFKSRLRHRRAHQTGKLISVLKMNAEDFFGKLDEMNERIADRIHREFRDEFEKLDRIDNLKKKKEAEERLFGRLRRRHFSSCPQKFLEDLDKSRAMKIEAESMDIEGISIRPSSKRRYPGFDADTRVGGHIIGYVATPDGDGSDYIPILKDSNDPAVERFVDGETTLRDSSTFKAVIRELYARGRLISDLVGRDGVEASQEKELSFTRGIRVETRNVVDNTRRIYLKQPAVNGANVTLTIDWKYQAQVEKILAQAVTNPELPPIPQYPKWPEIRRGGAAVAINPENGEILAMASYPRFDPNVMVPPLSHDEWKKLNNPTKPLLNRCIQGKYPLGSCFKIVTALAALTMGVSRREMAYQCGGYFKLGKNIGIHCEGKVAHGQVDLHRALKVSCNGFFCHLGTQRKVGANGLRFMAMEFGFGSKTGIDLPGESPGRVPSQKWHKRVIKQPWTRGHTANLAIGQGDLQVTPLQAAHMIATVAGNGKRMRPHVVKQPGKTDDDYFLRRLSVTRAHLKQVQEGLRGVVNEPGGTGHSRGNQQRAYSHRHIKNGNRLVIAGKSGSAQVYRMPKNSHAWFVAYAPYENPKIAVAVIIEYAGGGGRRASPTARKIIEAYGDMAGFLQPLPGSEPSSVENEAPLHEPAVPEEPVREYQPQELDHTEPLRPLPEPGRTGGNP